MPSAFPGMDPYLEGQEWEDFHTDLIATIRAVLSPQLLPRYLVRVERRVYVEHTPGTPARSSRPDLAIIKEPHASAPWGGVAVLAHPGAMPVPVVLPMPDERREAYLEIRFRETREVVTVIEVLSPTNKRPNSDGRREYLFKREAVLQSPVHLVEIDLLRGGDRMPVVEPFPPGDYCAMVSRAPDRPLAQLWALHLRDPLPTIQVPLSGSDPDASLDLQTAFETVYEHARYDYSLEYDREAIPPLTPEDFTWAQQMLKAAGQERTRRG